MLKWPRKGGRPAAAKQQTHLKSSSCLRFSSSHHRWLLVEPCRALPSPAEPCSARQRPAEPSGFPSKHVATAGLFVCLGSRTISANHAFDVRNYVRGDHEYYIKLGPQTRTDAGGSPQSPQTLRLQVIAPHWGGPGRKSSFSVRSPCIA